MTNDVFLVAKICEQSFTYISEEYDPEEFDGQYSDELRAAGAIFQFLGLGVRDANNQVGWRPTALFMKIIAERLIRPDEVQIAKEGALVLSTLDAIVSHELHFDIYDGPISDRPGQLTYAVLEQIGLVCRQGGKKQCTERLLDIFQDAVNRVVKASVANPSVLHKFNRSIVSIDNCNTVVLADHRGQRVRLLKSHWRDFPIQSDARTLTLKLMHESVRKN